MTETTTMPAPTTAPATKLNDVPMQSESIGKIAGALAKAQSEMSNVLKDKANPHFRSTYADLAGMIDACRPALAKNELAFLQSPLECHDGIRLQTKLIHSSGEWIADGVLYVPVVKIGGGAPDAQSYGSALTYARRYAIAAFIGLAPEDDDGESAVGRPAGSSASKPAKANTAPAELVWPFGDKKGTPLVDMPTNDLEYMIGREIKDDNFKERNLAMQSTCIKILEAREKKTDTSAPVQAPPPAKEAAEAPGVLIPLYGAVEYDQGTIADADALTESLIDHLGQIIYMTGRAASANAGIDKAMSWAGADGRTAGEARQQMTNMIAKPVEDSPILEWK